jgi:hypothetical protein
VRKALWPLLLFCLFASGCAGVQAVVARLDPAALAHAKAEQKQTLLAKGVHPLAPKSAWYYMDRQEARLREALAGSGARVAREGDRIVIRLPAGLATGGEPDANDRHILDSVAQVMAQFQRTFASVSAPAGPSGTALVAYLAHRGVDRDRILPLPEPASPRHPEPVRFTLEPLTR